MSIIYMQMWLLQKDFPRDHGVGFPASSESDCPSAHMSLSLGVLRKVVWVDQISPRSGYPSTVAAELKIWPLYSLIPSCLSKTPA